MRQIIECVPNVSEGRDKQILNHLSSSIESIRGVQLLHIDIGESTNRTVFTFAGEPGPVTEAAFALIKTASEHIDMRRHTGTHPRIGAVDVCPLIPVSGISMEETLIYADALAKKVGEELMLPVYLYANSALTANRINLENIRRGEYEGLTVKIITPEWIPDYGPSEYKPHFGAIAIGARNFLIAYNINLNTQDVSIARMVAAEIRESGRIIMEKVNGQEIKKRIPGLLKCVKAIGWYEERHHCAQVSINLIDYRVTGIEKVFKTVSDVSKKYKISVTGSEIIGLIPINSIIKSIDIKNHRVSEENIEKKIQIVEKKLKIKLFEGNSLKDKIIEYKFLNWSFLK